MFIKKDNSYVVLRIPEVTVSATLKSAHVVIAGLTLRWATLRRLSVAMALAIVSHVCAELRMQTQESTKRTDLMPKSKAA